jgi:hypothetical protein
MVSACSGCSRLPVAILALATDVSARPRTIVVEDWSQQPEGRPGIPEGWTGHSWGSPKYDFAVAADGPNRVLRLRSRGDNSTISKEIKIDVARNPQAWRLEPRPPQAGLRKRGE